MEYKISKGLKGKVLPLGGLIHEYKDESLVASRSDEYYTESEKKIIRLLTINDDKDTIVAPIGSFSFKIQKYPSDIDINEIVHVGQDGDIKGFIEDLKRMIRRIQKASKEGVYFSDFKAGNYVDSETKEVKGIKWTAEEILEGYNKEHKVTLEEAIRNDGKPTVIKIDVIVLGQRIIEASAFFILMYPDHTKYINVPSDFFVEYINTLKKEVVKFSTKGKNYKLFKAMKRLWSLARLQKNYKILQQLAPLIDSNISLLGQINADIETTILLLEKYKINEKIDKKLNMIFNNFLKSLSTIADIEVPDLIFEEINNSKYLINKLYMMSNYSKIDNEEYEYILKEIVKKLEDVHNDLLEIINAETEDYLKSINFIV